MLYRYTLLYCYTVLHHYTLLHYVTLLYHYTLLHYVTLSHIAYWLVIEDFMVPQSIHWDIVFNFTFVNCKQS